MGGVLSHLVGGGEKYSCFIRETASEGRRDEGEILAVEGGKEWEVGIKQAKQPRISVMSLLLIVCAVCGGSVCLRNTVTKECK